MVAKMWCEEKDTQTARQWKQCKHISHFIRNQSFWEKKMDHDFFFFIYSFKVNRTWNMSKTFCLELQEIKNRRDNELRAMTSKCIRKAMMIKAETSITHVIPSFRFCGHFRLVTTHASGWSPHTNSRHMRTWLDVQKWKRHDDDHYACFSCSMVSFVGSVFFSCVSVFFNLVLSNLVTSSTLGLSDMMKL